MSKNQVKMAKRKYLKWAKGHKIPKHKASEIFDTVAKYDIQGGTIVDVVDELISEKKHRRGVGVEVA